jgi:ABC-type dipeptide/oligopeptide/nickel transport system permease subunit
MIGVAVFAPILAPYDPARIDLRATLQTPSAGHWLGTDANGRDVLSRMIWATRSSLLATVEAVTLACTFGVLVGLLSGYVGGWLDMLLMRLLDAMLSIPGLLIAMGVIGMLGPGLGNAMLALAIMLSPVFVRLARTQVLVIVEETFVEAARTIGVSDWRIVLRHIVPNIGSPILVQLFMGMGYALLAEGALSYLGLAVQPPMASWGSILKDAFSFIVAVPWLIFIPGLAIMLAVLCFNTIGDALRSALLGQDEAAGWS